MASKNEGDGKSFIAQHLVESFKTIGKKALYVDADLRNKENCYPADIFASEDFAKQMYQAKTDNDYVIIDSPALGKYDDALQLAQFADATVYVAKAGSTLNSDFYSLKNKAYLPYPMIVFNNI